MKRLRHALPESVHIAIIANSGFGSTILFDHLLGLNGIDFIIRFRQNYYFESETYSGQALNADSLFRQSKENVAGALKKNRNDNAFTQLCGAYPKH
ncbi:MAG: hypothetical protein JXR76_28830 [Deltaproteobacteria bacterium]|nr:hypothetical protein [Deltaproteobacteria bacterium]